MEGVEQISKPFRFEIELVSRKTDIDSVAMLEKPCFLAHKHGLPIKGSTRRGIQTIRKHGVLNRFEQAGSVNMPNEEGQWVLYRAVLVPRPGPV